MSHTPAPWTVSAGEVTTADGDVFIAELASRDRPCAVQNPTEAEANAHLIAAAPELLEVVKAVAAHFENTDAPLGAWAQAMIAKAEGV